MRILNEQDDARRDELVKAFRNDLKARIDETAKYVRPDADTLEFAMMFIPADGIYYDLLVNEIGAKSNAVNLVDYGMTRKNVIIVSSTTFAAYLLSVLHGFKAFRFEETSRDIAKNVELLARHLRAFEEFHKRLGTTLDTTVNHYKAASRESTRTCYA